MTPAELLSKLAGAWPFFVPADIDASFTTVLKRLGVPDRLELGPRGQSTWVLQGTTVSMSGTLVSQVYGVSATPIYIRLAPTPTSFALLLDIELPQTWTFGTSFAALKGSVLDELRLADLPAKKSALLVATGPILDPQRQSGGGPLAIQSAGLSFFGWFKESSPGFGSLQTTLAGAFSQPAFAPIEYDAGVGTVEMQISLASVRIPRLLGANTDLGLEVSVYSGSDPMFGSLAGYTGRACGIRLSADVSFGGSIKLVALMRGGSDLLELSLSSPAFELPSPQAIAELLGAGNQVQGTLPSIQGATARVEDLTLGIGLTSQTLELVALRVSLLGGDEWKLGGGFLTATAPIFSFVAFKPLDPHNASYQFSVGTHVTVASVARVILVGQTGTDGPTIISGRLDPELDPPALTTLVQNELGHTNGLPQVGLAVTDLEFEANISEHAYSGEIEVEGDWSFDFGWDSEFTLTELRIAFEREALSTTGQLESQFSIGDSTFAVALSLSEATTTFKGEWHGDPIGDEGGLTYIDIAAALGMYWLPNPPAGLDLSLAAAEFTFDSQAPNFAFAVETSSFGEGVLVLGRDTAKNWGYVFGVRIPVGAGIDVATVVPLGQLLPPGSATLAIDQLRLIGASPAMPPIPSDKRTQEALGAQLHSGLVLALTLSVGTAFQHELAVRFGGPNDGSQTNQPPQSATKGAGAPVDAAHAAAQAQPVPVQRAFGPLQMSRIDFSITSEAELAMRIDAALVLAGLRIALVGLEATVALAKLSSAPASALEFALEGLAVEYRGGGLTIAGSLAKVQAPALDNGSPGRGATSQEWQGALTISYGRFGATANGGYSTANGEPSLFAFVLIDYPLGGPPIFFVTGLAGGFGFNRRLQLPTIATVGEYPLVKGAMGGGRDSTRSGLGSYITTAAGQSWAAAGIHFTSFGMIDSFLLATMAFGAHVELALIGRSTVKIPASTTTQPVPPVAQATIDLLVDYDPTVGQLAVDAQLAPQSFVLSPNAKLQGGLSFYTWFPPSTLAGDFVVTLGGYNPWFSKPAHYPQVPRLALNWQLDSLTVKGSLYFALSPSVVMAGGRLEASWRSGDLEAWFTAQADFLVRFKPFQYEAEVSVSIGVSYKLDLYFTTKKITASANVKLSLWGPPFGGQAHVDLTVVSFTLGFGAGKPARPGAVDWPEFRRSFLPKLTKAGPELPPQISIPEFSAPAYETDSLITIGAPAGLKGPPGAKWLVDPAALCLRVGLQVPATSASLVTDTLSRQLAGSWSSAIGVAPMNVAAGKAAIKLEVEIKGSGSAQDWHTTPDTSSVPSALWSSATTSLQAPALVAKALTGMTLVPTRQSQTHSVAVARSVLALETAPRRAFSWSPANVPDTDSFGGWAPFKTLEQKLGDPTVAAFRGGVIRALAAQGASVSADRLSVQGFAQHAEKLLASPPLLRLLGEQLTTKGQQQ